MEARETSGATTRLLLAYVRHRGGDAAVEQVLGRAGLSETPQQLEDLSRWVSYDTRIRLFEAATAVLGDPDTMFKVGATSLENGVNHALVLLLRTLGSPKHVLRRLPRTVVKFSTTSTMEILEAGATSATIRYRLHDGYEHSRLDCAYALGLFSVIPKLFGLPPARIVHTECQSDGRPACLYHISWRRPSRLPWRRGATTTVDPELAALRGQLEALQSAASDLVDSDGLDVILQRITDRAASAVLAPAYLLAVEAPSGGPPLVHSVGLDDAYVVELAPRLLAGEDLGRHAVVVDVATSRRSHGRLAALYNDGQSVVADERPLLQAYARHAAAALDMLIALDDSRQGESRANALLKLAHALATADDTSTVADVVAVALPHVVGSSANSVMLWDAGVGELRTVACVGLDPASRDRLLRTPIRVEDTPELRKLLARHEPLLMSVDTASPCLQELFRFLGLQTVAAVPLVADDVLLGVVTSSWRAGEEPDAVDEMLTRLQGVGDQAATAIAKAQLLSRVRHQSLHDSLTGLPNRVLFADRLDQALRGVTGDEGVAVLFCDLDRFKQVNDVHGHAAGDELLRQIAARLRGVVRPGDTVGRLSGDEFAILLSDADPVAAYSLAGRVIRCFTEPFRIEGGEQRITTSVGVAVHHGPDGRGDRLLRDADTAMYEAKQRGRNQVCTAGASPAGVPVTPSLEAELAGAISRDELRVLFQPIVRATGTGLEVAGAEALVRWQHPRLGPLAPATFLPVAEESGLVVDLDLWAVAAACTALAGWEPPSGEPLHVAVNVAAVTLLDPRLRAAVRDALSRHGLEPWQLHIEVVESRSLVDLPTVVGRLAELRQLGVRVALDDFGTGYSTLAWLQQLPVDQIKIDRTFTGGLPDDPASLAVVRGVLALARELGVEVVAEGVEEWRQLTALRESGCELLQGYLLGRPAPGAPAMPAASSAMPVPLP